MVLEFDQIKLYGSLTKADSYVLMKSLKKAYRGNYERTGDREPENSTKQVEKAKQWDEITEEEISQFLEDLS